MPIGRRLRTVKGWFSWRNDASAQIVFTLNGGVALVAGFAALWWLALPIPVALAIAAGTFVALTASLFRLGLAIIAALAASSVAGLATGVFGASLFGLGTAGLVAGALIGAGAFSGTFVLYRGFVRSTTGAGDLEGRYVGTFNERDEKLKKGSGSATVVVAPTDAGDHDLRITGLVVGGVAVELCGIRREEETVIADLSKAGGASVPFELLRGKAMVDGATLIVDLEGMPFGSYVFTGRRERG